MAFHHSKSSFPDKSSEPHLRVGLFFWGGGMTCDPALARLDHRLMHARKAERLVPYAIRATSDWKPTPQLCHENVRWWVARHEGCSIAAGWLVFDFSRASNGVIDIVRFVAHSALYDPQDGLIDITPSRGAGRYPFVLHPGPAGEFAELVSAGTTFLDCRAAS